MKQRIKHFSKSTMSVILAFCMLVSCLTVGLIATDAAQVTSENRVGASVGDDESVGWTAADCYMHYSADGGTNWVNAAMDSEEKITLTLYSETTIRYFLVAESTWYRYNGHYTEKPSGTSTSSDNFYARISGTWNNNTTSDSDYIETTLPSGVYTITYETRYEYGNTSNVTLKYHFYRSGDAETQYAVTISAGTGGSVSPNSKQVGATTQTLPTAVPDYGYKFSGWTTEDTSTITLGNASSANAATISASGAGTVTANFAPDDGKSLYIAGRFHVKATDGANTYINTWDGSTSDNWDDDSEVIQLLPTGNDFEYSVNTHCSFTELSQKIGDGSNTYYPYFFIYDKDITKRFFAPSSSTYLNASTTYVDLVEEGTTGAANSNMRFDYTSDDGPVIIFYNTITKRLRYELEGENYFVTSAGANDSTAGFTSNIWAAKDSAGKMTDNGNGTYSITFSEKEMGWYRFKINGYDGAASLGTWGGANVTYASDEGTAACITDKSTENSGNAKFYLTKTSDVTVTINTSTHEITVSAAATPGTVTYQYYIVGMASDGTSGMFDNVWADDWKVFSAEDKMTTSDGGTTYTLEKNDFGGSYGTYTYEAVRVGSDGSKEYYPGNSVTQTVDVTQKAKKVVYTLTFSGGDFLSLTADVTNKSNSSDETYDTIFVKGNKDDNYHLLYSSSGSQAAGYSHTSIQAYKITNSSSQNVYYFKIPVSSYVSTSSHAFLVTKNGTNYYNCASGNSSTLNISATRVERAKTYLTVETNNFNGDVNSSYKDNRYHYAKAKFNDSSYTSHFNYIVLAYNSSTKTYTFDVYGDASGGGTDPSFVNFVDLYAKNGNLRDSSYNRFTNLANTDVMSVTTPDGIVYTKDSHANWGTATSGGTWVTDKSGYDSNYDKITNIPVGSKVVLRTTLSNNNQKFDDRYFSASHYLKAYSFNGYTYQLHTPAEAVTSGNAQYYEETWTAEAINAANMKSGKTVEITPIYYLKDNTYTKTFFIDGYEGLLQEKWGTLLCVYPYYKGSSNKSNAFGGYPGQPMLYWGGKFQMEIPLTVDGTATGKEIKGLTMHNAYWDLLHRKLDGKCDDGHCQTYDYDDFYKIYKEKNADTIFFRYKYYPKKDYSYNGATISAGHDNYGDGYSYDNHSFQNDSLNTAAKCVSAGNGVEIVTDYYGRQIDVFGTRLTSAQQSGYDGGTTPQTKELLLVSTGYKNTYVGHYATEWAVYAPASRYTKNNDAAHKFIGYISSSMLYLNNIGRVSQYSGGTNTGDGQMGSSKYKNTYNYLKEHYEGVPALISYEKEIHNYSLDQADRSDGKWYYSTSSDRLTANIKIQTTSATTDVTLLGDHNWTDSAFTAAGAGNETNVDDNGNSAYFTNTTPEYLYGKTTSGSILADPSGQFTFQAYSGNGWTFVGWVRYSDGKYYEIADKDGLGSSNISANDTYIARFMPAAKGSLVISHNIVKDSTHKGDGTKYLKVEVMNGDSVVKTYEKTDGSDIDVSGYIDSTKYSSYKLRITLVTEPDEDCAVADRSVALGADSKYDRYRTDTSNNSITPASALDAGVTYNSVILVNISDVYDDTNGVTALRYTTELTKTELNYAYRIVYTYKSRFWGNQTYTVEGFVDEMESAKYFSGVKSTATLNKSFIVSSTPYEKNFRQKIDWNYDSMTNNVAGPPQASVTINGTAKENVYFMQAAVGSTNTVDDTVRAEFFLPYKYNEETKSETGLDLYNAEGTKLEGTEIAFDDRHYESSTVKSQAGHLFNYDSSIPDIPTSGQTTDDFPKLVKAAPYVLKKGVWNTEDSKWIFTNLSGDDFHYADTYTTKEYDGNMSFEIGGTYYYATETAPEDIPPGASTQQLTALNTESWFDDNGTSATYTFAKKDGDNVYYFYFEENECLGYKVSSKGNVIDGIIQNSNAEMTTEPSDASYTFYKKFYFTRWDIFTADGKTFVASSFANSRAFNYSGYEDYIIIPVYNDKESNSGRSTTITFMGDTRNQWNMGGLGHYKSGAVASQGEESTNLSDCDTQGDKILIDFGLAFNNAGTKLTPDDRAGFIIERLDKLDTTEGIPVTGLKDSNAITSLSYYEKKYAAGSGNAYAYDSDAVLSSANGFAADSSNKTKPTCSGAAIFRAATIAKLDNFDRMQYTNTFTNLKDSGQTEQALYVYRATSYLKVNNQDTVISEPIYFTIYDIASR